METKTYIPAAFGKAPETSTEALLSAAALLEEEGRWRQCAWFKHDDPSMEEYKDDPFCNGWQACADGALQIVTVGLIKKSSTTWDTFDYAYVYSEERENHGIDTQRKIYSEARDRMTSVIKDRNMGSISGIETYNDCHSRDEVVALLREVANMEDTNDDDQ